MHTEHDALGAVSVPDDVDWGAQTERSRHHFPVGPLMPLAVVRGLITIKLAAAQAAPAAPKRDAIVAAAQALLGSPDAELAQHFPLHVYQTGSGTQTNMNVNEVIAHRASQLAGVAVHPNDDVNAGQSSNDDFPTAMNLAAYPAVTTLIMAVTQLTATLAQKAADYAQVVKLGRTHLQDATPLTLGQEISGWQATLAGDAATLTSLQSQLLALPLGGTAVGTGLNTTPARTAAIIANIAAITDTPYSEMPNKFHGLTAHSELTTVHGAVRTLATDLIKIANDLRFLASGPRGGYGELSIPANEPGSSIMPGKVNPTQAEALTMIGARVIGNDATIGFANSQGNFELNVYKPIIISAFLDSCSLLAGGITQFTQLLVAGFTANVDHMQNVVANSLMLVTALAPHIGYEKAAQLAQQAQASGASLKAVALASGWVSAADFAKWVDPLAMTNPQALQ
ncbi:class II fumarate hydratase [Lacticaseibacillus nasuensis]|uniref:class II fumarate hydratase n=1 Tax=Lacticaseibacillus nasuensis TaxID=944671 RepID=UPI002245E3CE|nr:class II fumarate hydratase [Lacticaseibacillus nasuensis]MCX2455750.1 class II fumarate hydratase [Lacticaseibacillus nasuensis]